MVDVGVGQILSSTQLCSAIERIIAEGFKDDSQVDFPFYWVRALEYVKIMRKEELFNGLSPESFLDLFQFLVSSQS